jgi:hypothetical protein
MKVRTHLAEVVRISSAQEKVYGWLKAKFAKELADVPREREKWGDDAADRYEARLRTKGVLILKGAPSPTPIPTAPAATWQALAAAGWGKLDWKVNQGSELRKGPFGRWNGTKATYSHEIWALPLKH